MKTVLTLTNGDVTVTLNREASVLENFRNAATKGFTGGQTSFRNLWNGKVSQVKGFTLKEVEPAMQAVVKKARRNANAAADQARKMLEALNPEINVVGAARQVYGTARNSVGRVQLDPKADGTFRVALYENSQHTQQDLENVFAKAGCEFVTKNQYVHAFDVTPAQAKKLLNA